MGKGIWHCPPFSKIQLFEGLKDNSYIYHLSHLEEIGSMAIS